LLWDATPQSTNRQDMLAIWGALPFGSHWLPDMGRLQYECNRLPATCSITNKQNHNIAIYVCLEISLEREEAPFSWFDVSIFSDNVRY